MPQIQNHFEKDNYPRRNFYLTTSRVLGRFLLIKAIKCLFLKIKKNIAQISCDLNIYIVIINGLEFILSKYTFGSFNNYVTQRIEKLAQILLRNKNHAPGQIFEIKRMKIFLSGLMNYLPTLSYKTFFLSFIYFFMLTAENFANPNVTWRHC